MSTLVRGQRAQPAQNFNFLLYTPNSDRFPRDGFGVDSIEPGFEGGTLATEPYSEGNDLEGDTHVPLRTTYEELTVERAWDGSTNARDWWLQCTEQSPVSLRDGGGGDRPSVPIQDDVVVSLLDRVQRSLVLAQVTYLEAFLTFYRVMKLEKTGTGKILREQFKIRYKRPIWNKPLPGPNAR